MVVVTCGSCGLVVTHKRIVDAMTMTAKMETGTRKERIALLHNLGKVTHRICETMLTVRGYFPVNCFVCMTA